MEIIGLIPARGDSKSVPKKNIKLLAGKPLIAYTIEEAKKSKLIKRIIVSTDNEEIAEISQKYGAEVPFMRPKQLAEDDTPDLPVFQHALRWLEENEGYKPDIIIHLRPTAPFRRAEDIDAGIEKLIATGADSVRSVCLASQIPQKMWRLSGDRLIPLMGSEKENYNLPRQKLEKIYWQNASVDVIRCKTIMKKNSMSGRDIRALIMPEEYSVDLDTEVDFMIAESILKTMRR